MNTSNLENNFSDPIFETHSRFILNNIFLTNYTIIETLLCPLHFCKIWKSYSKGNYQVHVQKSLGMLLSPIHDLLRPNIHRDSLTILQDHNLHYSQCPWLLHSNTWTTMTISRTQKHYRGIGERETEKACDKERGLRPKNNAPFL